MAVVDVSTAREVKPANAPVGSPSPLSGRERAGINLTWGVLGLMLVFLAFALTVMSCHEARADAAVGQMMQGAMDEAKLNAHVEARAAFRTFWWELTKTILLNVLLPVLTGLLGYVFGTTQAGGARA